MSGLGGTGSSDLLGDQRQGNVRRNYSVGGRRGKSLSVD